MVTDGSKILRWDASCRRVDRRRELDELRLGLQESVGRLSDIARSMPGMAQESSPTDLINSMFTEQTAALRRESEAVRRIEQLMDSALARLVALESDAAQSKERTAREAAKLRADVAAATCSAAEASTAAGDVRVRLDAAVSTLATQDGRLDHLERELGSAVRTACEAHRRATDELRAVEQRRAQAVASEEANWADRLANIAGAEQEEQEHAKLRSEFRSALVGGLASANQKQNDRIVEVRADLLRDLAAEREARLADAQETRQEFVRAVAILKEEQDRLIEAARDTQAELTVLAGAVRTGLGCGRADSGGGGLPRRPQAGIAAGSQWSAHSAAWKEASVPKLDTEKKAEENEEEDFLRRWPHTANSDLVFEKPPLGAAVGGLESKKQGDGSSPLGRQATTKPPSLASPTIAAGGKAEMIQEGGGRRWSSSADQRKQEVQEEKKKAEVQQEERRGNVGSQRAAARRAALKAMEAMEAAADKLERSTRSSSTGCLLEVPAAMAKNK